MKIITFLTLVLLLLFCKTAGVSLPDPALEEWRNFSQTVESRQLVEWLRCLAKAKLSGGICKERLKIATPQFYGKLGIFVTLKKGKNVRGCYGAFFHSTPDIADVLSDYISGALLRDHRYKPIGLSELKQTEIIITIASQPSAVSGPDSIDTLRYGIALSCGDSAMTVYVPYELRSVQDLRKLFREKECQASFFEAVTIR
jgi:AMMECR1 domain-containing protein